MGFWGWVIAYDFSALDNAMANQNNTNIFNSQDGGSQAQGGASQQPSNMGAANGPTQQPSQSKPQTAKQPANVGAEVMKKNKTPEAGANFVGGIQQQAAKTKENLQNEANSYVQNTKQQAEGYRIGNPLIDKAIGGDMETLGSLQSRLQGPGPNISNFEQKTNADLGDINKISTDAGLQKYLKQRGGEGYTGGMAALDQMLLTGDKGFQAKREGLANEQNQLKDLASKTKESAQKEGHDYAQDVWETETKKAKDYLGQQASAEDQREANELAQERQARQALLANGGVANEAALKAQNEMLANVQQLSPDMAQYYKQAAGQLNNRDYYHLNQLNEGDTITQDEAARMNRIQQLLGTGKMYGAGRGLGDVGSFDVNAYQAALSGLAGKNKQSYNLQQQQEEQRRQAILNDANQRAATGATVDLNAINGPGYGGPQVNIGTAPVIDPNGDPYAGINQMFRS